MADRKVVEEYIIKYIDKIAPGGENKSNYQKLFASMTNKDFSGFIDDLESGKKHLAIVVPNFTKNKLDIGRNFKIGDEIGVSFFKRVWVEGRNGLPPYMLPIEHMVLDLVVRRASQLLIKKIKVPDNTKSVDGMTGQPTGASKGATITYPELGFCAAAGLENSMLELDKYRGGDTKGLVYYNNMLSKTGRVNLTTLKQFSGKVVSTQTLSTLLTCMHLRNNI